MSSDGTQLVHVNGRVYVVPDPLRCTARTTKRRRCALWAWTYDVSGTWVHVVSRSGVLYVVDTVPAFLDALREQRCGLHGSPDVPAYCAPESVPFDPQRHAYLLQPLTDEWVCP